MDDYVFYGILFDCPAGERFANCPIKRIKHFSFKDRVQWFESLNHLEKCEIIEYHIKCSQERRISKNSNN